MLSSERGGTAENLNGQDAMAFDRLKIFCANIVKKLAPPLLKEVRASTLRPEAEPFTPKRTTRAAKRIGTASSGPAKPKPTENVLLKTLGLVPEDMVPDEVAVQELRMLFDSPLREQQVQVIASLFGKTLPSVTELEGSEGRAIAAV